MAQELTKGKRQNTLAALSAFAGQKGRPRQEQGLKRLRESFSNLIDQKIKDLSPRERKKKEMLEHIKSALIAEG